MPSPYVVTLLYHTNIDNCVTKTRFFSEFSIFIICSNKQCIWKFSKCHKSVRADNIRPYKIVQTVAIIRSGINVFHLSNYLHERKNSTFAHSCAWGDMVVNIKQLSSRTKKLKISFSRMSCSGDIAVLTKTICTN